MPTDIENKLLIAISMIKELREQRPNKVSYQMLEEQFFYILECLKKSSKIEKSLTIGILAVREIENSNPEFAELIYSIDNWVDKNKQNKGLSNDN